MEIRKIKAEEWTDAMALAWRTFLQFEAGEYDAEGVKNFYKLVTSTELEKMFLVGEYKAIGAFDKGNIVGIIGARNTNFLSILFVDEKYHRRGIGTELVGALVDYLQENTAEKKLLVFAAPYAKEFYHHIGFEDIDELQRKNGIIYTPMVLKI